MTKLLNDYIQNSDDEWSDTHYGTGYRCSVDLKDGLHLPCVMLRRPNATVELARRRFEEEKKGRGVFSRNEDGYKKIVEQFVTTGNRLSDFDIVNITPSRFAIPKEILKQIEGETVMSWTGWVFEMRDGKLFSFGSTFLFEFFNLPNGYNFSDVAKVHNHSFLDQDGKIKLIRENMDGMMKYRGADDSVMIYRERPYFTCFVKET